MRRFTALLALLATAGTALPAQQVISSGPLVEGTLSFDGRATLGDFTGTTTTVSGAVVGGELAGVRGWVEAPVATLKTGNGRRDRDLNKSMESEKYPAIRFDLSSVTPGISRGDTTAVTLAGTFTIHGVAREVTLPGTLVFDPGSVRLRSVFPMNLEDYRIEGLSKMLGLLKMHPDITVRVDLRFEQ